MTFEIGINWHIRVTSDLYTNLPIYPNFKMLDEAVKDEASRLTNMEKAVKDEMARSPMLNEAVK